MFSESFDNFKEYLGSFESFQREFIESFMEFKGIFGSIEQSKPRHPRWFSRDDSVSMGQYTFL